MDKSKNEEDIKINIVEKLTEENCYLQENLHLAQEKLEIYYNKLIKIKNNKDFNNSFVEFPQQIHEILKENIKLLAIVNFQKKALQIERQNCLAARLGQILIKGVSCSKEFILLPIKLYKIWNALDQTKPPMSLGGEGFKYVIEAYHSGSVDAVEKILNTVFISSVMRANAYTELAKHLQLSDTKQAVKFAHLAWETDPRPYRLKWLAFRLYDAKKYIEASVILDMLPNNYKISETDKQHIERINKRSEIELLSNVQKTIENLPKTNQQLDNIYKLKHELEKNNNEKKQLSLLLDKTNENYKKDVLHINSQLTDSKKIIDQLNKEIMNLNRKIDIQQRIIETQKSEYKSLIEKISFIIKNLIIKFETESDKLSQIIHIIIDNEKKLH